MLKFAMDYEEALKRTDRACWLDQDKKWYYSDSWNRELTIDRDDWNNIQMVSVDNDDNIHGYFHVGIDEVSGKLHSLGVINYGPKCDITFSKDFYAFLKYLFVTRGFRKLEWTMTVGNPIEKMYDRFCKKVGGNIVGVLHDSTILRDRTLHDQKIFEVFRDGVIAYLESKKGKA